MVLFHITIVSNQDAQTTVIAINILILVLLELVLLLKNRGKSVPQCVKTLSIASMKPSLLQCHLQTNHPDKKDCDPNYFRRLEENAKKQRLD